jgi:hypothetical protein
LGLSTEFLVILFGLTKVAADMSDESGRVDFGQALAKASIMTKASGAEGEAKWDGAGVYRLRRDHENAHPAAIFDIMAVEVVLSLDFSRIITDKRC